MALEKIVKRALILDQLIRQKNTGNIEQLAVDMEVSRRQVYNYLKVLEKIGKSCEFDHKLQSYVYLDEPEVQ
ncbi:MAG: helix-turn-helix domain-containing protein [Cytophagales bacterium]|nr:helix-turn-helix domain-containing protein [Cytophagales bacterium]